MYQSRHLTVTGASSKHLLAMKLLAARGKDREDIAVLCKRLGLKGPNEAIRIYKELFPDEKLKNRASEFLDWAFRTRAQEHERDTGPSR